MFCDYNDGIIEFSFFPRTPSEVSDYYDGTGYSMAFIKAPDKKTKRLFRFHTNSRESDALLFYIESEVQYKVEVRASQINS